MAASSNDKEPWFLRYSVPVQFPAHAGFDLAITQADFEAWVRNEALNRDDDHEEKVNTDEDEDDTFTMVTSSTSQEVRHALEDLEIDSADETPTKEPASKRTDESDEHPFIQGLVAHGNSTPVPSIATDNKMLTENSDVAFRSTRQALLDLFFELEDVVSGPRLLELLNAAWIDSPLMTLKIIFNARSIHLGKASRATFYRCAGWLAQNHPLTLVSNLRWLSRPVIEKKVVKKETGEEDEVLVDLKPEEKDEDDVTRFDVKNGVAHGCWKDLLNILVLCINGKLDVLANPRDILNVEREGKDKNHRGKEHLDKEEAKTKRHDVRNARHEQAVDTFNSNAVYRALYLTIAPLFAEQLRSDLLLFHGEDKKAKKKISLCAKWAPSQDRFHDKHTFIVSSIAEMLHPLDEVTGGSGDMDRELYLRHARERYRKDISALRAHLDVVERNLSAKTLDKIKYERVPSVAMSNYAKIFAEKDTERFEEYINAVAEGKTRISGATLLPSTLISTVRRTSRPVINTASLAKNPGKAAIEAKVNELDAKVADGQWKTLVQRIKDSGTLESTIAVCDVSGSMSSPVFPDGTCPMDSAIGLSLLLAEVTAPPFGGHFITFSARPGVLSIDLSSSLHDKISAMERSHWEMNTNFVAVFEELILPVAIRNNLKQEDMVKRIFVFSDMQFDTAQARYAYSDGSWSQDEHEDIPCWSTSFEKIRGKYAEAGYEMPDLVFWNLAGGRAGYGGCDFGDPTAPKPVTAEEPGTALVSGYSQGMLKVFLENGSFDVPDDEDDKLQVAEDGDAVVLETESRAKRQKMDPMNILKKAIGHKAYDSLKVMD
ncbi:Uu.00g103580.m01.CDS01 [Anthostomella pinea]|uniref:Uu.00g103580.m01.CDS01 n=1 Tax=Anthostomella pinea TaxID=933095 RepID=A0AAI8VDP1_9PEZI|nr:Uu.00g103580.m01.CDS01 [Anthostomella pinea]